MTKSSTLALIVLSVLSLLLFSHGASASCFSGPRLVEDDSYKGYEFTNNCASGAKVYWRRTYRKGDGSFGSESDYWFVSSCSTETKQHFQGDYTFGSVEVDESKTCIDKDARRTDIDKSPQSGTADRQDNGSGENRKGVAAVAPGQTDRSVAELARQRSEFDLAQKMDSVEGWRAFLKEYPEGVDAQWAKKRIAELSNGGASVDGDASSTPRNTGQIDNIIISASIGGYSSIGFQVTGDEVLLKFPTLLIPCGLDRLRKTDIGPDRLRGWDSRFEQCRFSRTSDGLTVARVRDSSGNGGGYVHLKEVFEIAVGRGRCNISSKFEVSGYAIAAGARMTKENMHRDSKTGSYSGTCHVESQ